MPYNSNARVLLYRKDILEKHGLEVPTTWEELASVASAITENEPDMYGLGLTTAAGSPRTFQEFISFFFQVNNGENMFTREEGSDAWTINTTPEILAQVLELYQNLYFGSDPAAVNVDERGQRLHRDGPQLRVGQDGDGADGSVALLLPRPRTRRRARF